MSLRPYQIAPVAALAKSFRALLEARAASGKTVIAAAAINAVLARKPRERRSVRVGWVANTVEQCQQAKAALDKFPEIDRACVVRIRCAAAGDDWSDCDLLVCDECHHAVAPGWNKQIETCSNARWGLTATPNFDGDDAEIKHQILRDLFSDNVIKVDAEEVAKTLAKGRVILLSDTDPDAGQRIKAFIAKMTPVRRRQCPGASDSEIYKMVSWQACIKEGIEKNQARNAAAILNARNEVVLGRSVLVLVNNVEHAKQIALETNGVACYSGMGAKARRHALYDFKTGKLKCVVATSLADEGLDVPRASVLVLVSGGRSKNKAEQRTGRVLRAFAGKDEARIYDFADQFNPLMAKHAASRQEAYRRLGYLFEELL